MKIYTRLITVTYVRSLRPLEAGGHMASFIALVILFLSTFGFYPMVALADCTDPAGVAGEQVYNTTYSTMQFCDGTNWYSMKGGAVAEDTLGDLSCATNQIAKWNGSAWVCAADGGSVSVSDFTTATATVTSTATGGATAWSGKVFATCPANHSVIFWSLTGSNQWNQGGHAFSQASPAMHHYCAVGKQDATRAFVQILDQSNDPNIICSVTALCLKNP